MKSNLIITKKQGPPTGQLRVAPEDGNSGALLPPSLLISDSPGDALYDLDLMTGELKWNEGYKTIFGYDNLEAENSLQVRNSRIHVEDRLQVMQGFEQAIEKGRWHWSSEYRYACKTGGYKFVFD